MTVTKALTVSSLYRKSDAQALDFKSTRELEPRNDFMGQSRAKAALELSLAMRHDGYNLFAVGSPGIGKRTMIRRYLEQYAATLPAPSDWCYVNNFDDPRRPQAMEFPAGTGKNLKKNMEKFWRAATNNITAAFENDLYYERMEGLKGELSRAQQELLSELAVQGEKKGVKLVLRTPGGYGFSPMNAEGEVMSVDAFNTLPKKEQVRFKQAMDDMETRLRKVAKVLNREEQINRDKMRKLNEEVAASAVKADLDELRLQYQDHQAFSTYLDRLASDLLENLDVVLNQSEQQDVVANVVSDTVIPSRYQVNVVVSSDPSKGAPVVFEDLPTHYNLMGHVEQVTYMGTVATDFTLIRGGALHRANGGFLMLEAEQVLEQPYAWQGLKRALRTNVLKLSSLEQMLTLTGTISLEPDAIPFNVKVILLGDRETFYLLQQFDPELSDYFKVRADFEPTMDRSADNERLYAHFLTDFCCKEGLKPLDKSAVMRVIEECARRAEEQDKIALHAASVADLLRESNFWARQGRNGTIKASHVEHAISNIESRHDRLRRDFLEDIAKGVQLFNCDGEVVGQINGIAVLNYAGYEFGQPSRISVTAHYGSGDVTDIERDVDLGGALHSKGVMILSSYLKSVFGYQHTLRFGASIAFEQSYGEVDGDSASLGELCGLVSAISALPIQQRFGITGSVNQFGEVQPIGGVNEKIEGFFAACQVRGLTGKQAVIVPKQNVSNLMLRPEVMNAVKSGKFAIYAVTRIEEAVELLMGRPAGQRDAEGKFTQGSVFAILAERLESWRLAEKKDEEEEEQEDSKEHEANKPHALPATSVRRRRKS